MAEKFLTCEEEDRVREIEDKLRGMGDDIEALIREYYILTGEVPDSTPDTSHIEVKVMREESRKGYCW